MVEDEEVIQTVQEYSKRQIFERVPQGSEVIDRYQESWLRFAEEEEGMSVKEERLSRFTTKHIQAEVQKRFGTRDVDIEKKVGGASDLAFDLWNNTKRTAFEICLGAIKNEFEKDILKGILDRDTTRLVILYREYATGTQGKIYGHKWFEHPAQREMMDRAGIFKLEVEPISLLGPVP
jgi:hypothetical protein